VFEGPGDIYECGCADIPDGECDCDGNVLDECSDCGGDNYGCEDSANACACAGCTNSDADNDDSSASIDDGTCEYAEPGDMNNDGYIDILDLVLMANLILDYGYVSYADVNNDYIVNILDLIIVVDWILP
jgi:hypothetical protein